MKYGAGICVILSAIFLASCATTPQVSSMAESPIPSIDAPLVLNRGDIVEVRFFYHPELNLKQEVRPDGKISLDLVHEVDAAGMSPDELRVSLVRAYTGILIDPEISVVIDTGQRYVYVGGEVDIPSGQFPIRVPLIERLTPLEAIMQAGGFENRSAKLTDVLIIRRIEDRQYARTVDLSTNFSSDESTVFYLEPNDIVFVPRNKIDRVDQWVDQYMNATIPQWLRLNFNESL